MVAKWQAARSPRQGQTAPRRVAAPTVVAAPPPPPDQPRPNAAPGSCLTHQTGNDPTSQQDQRYNQENAAHGSVLLCEHLPIQRAHRGPSRAGRQHLLVERWPKPIAPISPCQNPHGSTHVNSRMVRSALDFGAKCFKSLLPPSFIFRVSNLPVALNP